MNTLLLIYLIIGIELKLIDLVITPVNLKMVLKSKFVINFIVFSIFWLPIIIYKFIKLLKELSVDEPRYQIIYFVEKYKQK